MKNVKDYLYTQLDQVTNTSKAIEEVHNMGLRCTIDPRLKEVAQDEMQEYVKRSKYRRLACTAGAGLASGVTIAAGANVIACVGVIAASAVGARLVEARLNNDDAIRTARRVQLTQVLTLNN